MADQGLQGPQGVQGEQGEKGEPGEAVLVPLAQEMVKQLVDGAAWSQSAIGTLNKTVRTLRRVVIGVIAIAVVLAVVAGYLLNENITHPIASQLRASIASQQTQTKSLELYVQQYAQHGCQALELLASKPVPKPADPAKNPSRETTYEFYEAILYWEHADGCSLTVHQITPPVK
jgi:hypothetical protein